MSKTGKETAKADTKPKHRRPEKLMRPGLSYEDDKEVVEIALKGDFAALEQAKAYLQERRSRVGAVDRERDHWMQDDAPASPSELARRKVRDWLKNLLKGADDEKEIRKSVAAVMLGISQSEYNALLRDEAYSDIRKTNQASMKTTSSGQSKRFARSMVSLKVVRAIEQKRREIELNAAADAKLPMATAKPRPLTLDPVEAPFEVPEYHGSIAIHMNADGLQAARVIGAKYYHVVDPETNKIVGQLCMPGIPHQRLAGFLTAGADLEYLTMHQALTQRTWLYVAEMKRWVDCFTVFARRKQVANIAMLDANKAAVSEDNVASLDALALAIENENRDLSVQIAEVDRALFEHILPAGPERKHVPL